MHTVPVEEARLSNIPVEVDCPSSLLDSHHEEDVGGDDLVLSWIASFSHDPGSHTSTTSLNSRSGSSRSSKTSPSIIP